MKVVPSPYIWFNGELIPWDEARVHVLSHVIHYGTGVFEGIRAYGSEQGTRVLGLDAHMRRLFRSASLLSLPMPFEFERLRSAVLETVRANEHEACYIRPFAFRGYGELGVDPSASPVDVVVATFPWGALLGEGSQQDGVATGVASWRRMAPDTHPSMAKASGNYINSALVVMEAKRHGYAEGIVLDVDGYVCEGSGENVFFVRDETLWTPPVGASILEGVTRGFVLQLAAEAGLPVREQRIPREMLYTSDEIFFSGTAAEITPVSSVDGQVVGAGSRGPMTTRLQEAFFEIVQGRTDDRFGWLTPVE
ncbi:MAG: branched-chain amino acid transaminase [Planctomycetota bacterium]|jgi:branched-chain amino acid aminotransferase|nr:branched-chain amino acid transaminase [Planctomycetota bacterium]MDP6989916.1 branched-chain amino acid transaminase [Planctomycetota bacterium]